MFDDRPWFVISTTRRREEILNQCGGTSEKVGKDQAFVIVKGRAMAFETIRRRVASEMNDIRRVLVTVKTSTMALVPISSGRLGFNSMYRSTVSMFNSRFDNF